MSILENKKNVLVGHIKTTSNSKVLGSCIPFKKGEDIFIITCAHVIYKGDWSGLRHELVDMEVEVNSCKYKLVDIQGIQANAELTDLSVVKIEPIDCQVSFSFVELRFFEIKNDMFLTNSKICVFPQLDERVQAVGSVKYAGTKNDYQYSVEVEKDRFYNINLGSAGASEYKGISGSGLFCEHNGQLFLQGVVKSLPNLSVNAEVDLISVQAFKGIWENVAIESFFEKANPHLHHNSPFNSDTSRDSLTRELLHHVSDKKYKVLLCAPSDNSSSSIAQSIYTKLVEKLDDEKINYSVGGGKEQLTTTGSYPHIEERHFIGSSECSTLIIIADDHSTFSQLSLLSSSIFNGPFNHIEVYLFYEESIINSQSFIGWSF